MKRSTTALLLSLVVSAAACSKLPGVSLPGGGSGQAAAVGDSAAAASDGAAAASDAARPVRPELRAYYQQLDHRSLYELLRNGPSDGSYELAQAEVGRDVLWQSGNPDPTWITSWRTDDNSYARANAAALVQAAFNRSWQEACSAEFATGYASHRALVAKLGPELDKIDRLRSHYARMAGYIALAQQFERAATAAGLDATRDPFGPSGLRVTILARAVAYHRTSPAAYAAFPWSSFGAVADATRDHGRELGADEAFERQAYCAQAAAAGGLTVTAYIGRESGAADPTVWGDREAVARTVAGQLAAHRKTFAVADAIRIPTIELVGGLTFHDREPTLALLTEGTVEAVSRSGDGATLTVTRKKLESYTYACKATSTVEGVGDDGRVRYKQSCKSGDKHYALTAKVTFADLPPGLTLAKGDVVTFSADVIKDASKKVTDTAAKVEWVRNLELTGRLLIAAKRGATPLPL